MFRIASVKGAAVVLVSNMKGGQGLKEGGKETTVSQAPALGTVWSNTANVR